MNLNAVASKKLDIVEDAVVAMASQHTALATSLTNKKLNEKRDSEKGPESHFLVIVKYY